MIYSYKLQEYISAVQKENENNSSKHRLLTNIFASQITWKLRWRRMTIVSSKHNQRMQDRSSRVNGEIKCMS